MTTIGGCYARDDDDGRCYARDDDLGMTMTAFATLGHDESNYDWAYPDESMTQLIVRDARGEDADSLARLCTQLGYSVESSEMPGRVARFDADANARALVAERDGAVIGLATIHLRYTMNHAAPIAQLTLLVVDESNRTRGVGRALVEGAEAWACERGSKRIVVTTALQRKDAHAFYERLSYSHTGRRYGKDFPR